MLLDKYSLLILNLPPFHQEYLTLVQLLSFHVLYLCFQLVYQDLLLVKLLFEPLDTLELAYSYVCGLSFLGDLSLEGLLRLLLFFFLRCYQDLVTSDLLHKFGDFTLRDDQHAISLAPTLLQLIDVRLQLLYHISQLLVLVSKLCLHTL